MRAGSCGELRFNISQVRASDSHRRTQLSLILIENSCACASAHRQATPLWIGNWMGNEPCAAQFWNMDLFIFLPHTPFHFAISPVLSVGISISVCLTPVYLCLYSSPSLSVYLTVSCSPRCHSSQWEGTRESPISTNERRLPPEEGLVCSRTDTIIQLSSCLF